MVLAQAGTSARDALLLMRAYAFAQGRTVREVARDVVSRSLDFTPEGD
jgi:AmiR/NasT family two-component response regulator